MIAIQNKKGIMGEIISVFVLILVVAIMAGLSFLFIVNLKAQVVQTTDQAAIAVNESGWLNTTPYPVGARNLIGFNGFTVILINNQTGQVVINSANYTVGTNTITGTGQNNWTNTNITYSYNYIANDSVSSYNAVNGTETAGSSVIGYLPLIFLAVIFGALLTLVLRTILPYINLGRQAGGF